MNNSENISNILKLNENLPALIIGENADIIKANEICKDEVRDIGEGESLFGLFDKNTALLVKNSFIDAKAFSKVQRRNIKLFIAENEKEVQILISPFRLKDKTYFYILFFGYVLDEYLIAYPTVDDFSITRKYQAIFNRLEKSLPHTLIEKKNFQYDLDIEKKSIFIKSKDEIVFTNNSFLNYVRLTADEVKTKNIKEILEKNIANKFLLAEAVTYETKNITVIESTDFSTEDLQQKNRMVVYPVIDFENNVIATINFGTIDEKRNEEKIKEEIKTETGKENSISSNKEKAVTSDTEVAQISFNADNFKIIKVNNKAVELYGYTIEELLQKDITDLCVPEDLQKLLLPNNANEVVDFKHIKKDGTVIEVEVKTELSADEKIKTSTIKIKNENAETPIISSGKDNKEIKEEKQEDKPEETITAGKNITKQVEKKPGLPKTTKSGMESSPFLSSLFHELLTPVNVILGFVQEIIDSIDKPTEEQKESAKIIKTNQQLLLQTMNTAVQYSQLIEGKIEIKKEEFLLNNYLLDLKESISRISEKENKIVNIYDLEEEIKLKNDRQKLLAAVSYFLKFAIKLSDKEKLNVTIKKDENSVSFLLNDDEPNVTEALAKTINEIYNLENPFDKKNYGISPIAIRLAKKLNEIVGGTVSDIEIDAGKRTAVTFPLIATENTETVTEPVKAPPKTPFEKDNNIKEKTGEEIDIINPVTEENLSAEVDAGIVKDIEEEREIATEEIVAQENISGTEKNDNNGIATELSCLLIEDSVDSQLLFEAQMKDFKLLKIVSGLTEALPLIKKYKFDLIYVDINLKGQYNGLDALRIIRQFENYKTIPIIAVTAYPFLGDREKFLKAGFTDYFKKPLLRKHLLSSLEQLFG